MAWSNSPIGPFRYVGSSRPNGEMARDMNLFQARRCRNLNLAAAPRSLEDCRCCRVGKQAGGSPVLGRSSQPAGGSPAPPTHQCHPYCFELWVS